MPYVRNQESNPRRKWVFQIAAIVLALALVAALFSALYVRQQSAIAENATAAQSFTPAPLPTPTTEPIPERVAVEDAVSRLTDTDRPFTVTVLGDSTGAPAGSWVEIIGQRLGETYDRPVIFHGWSLEPEPDAYLTEKELSTGSGAPITIWNGSAAGQAPEYTVEHLAELAPAEQSDLVFVNHGHNARPGELVSSASDLLAATAERYPDAAIAVVIQNPEHPDYGNASNHAANLAGLETLAARQGFPVIDVFSTYPEGALEDDVHPNAEGFKAWADTVWDAIT